MTYLGLFYLIGYLYLYFCCSLWSSVLGLSVVEWTKICPKCNTENLGFILICRSVGNLLLCAFVTFFYNFLKVRDEPASFFGISVHKSMFIGVLLSFPMYLFPFIHNLPLLLIINVFSGISFGIVLNSCVNCILSLSDQIYYMQLTMVVYAFGSMGYPVFMGFVMKSNFSPAVNLGLMYGVPLLMKTPCLLFLCFPSPHGSMFVKEVEKKVIEKEIDLIEDLSDQEEIKRIIQLDDASIHPSEEEDEKEKEQKNSNNNSNDLLLQDHHQENGNVSLSKHDLQRKMNEKEQSYFLLPLSSSSFMMIEKEKKLLFQTVFFHRFVLFVIRNFLFEYLTHEQFSYLIVSIIMFMHSCTETAFLFVIISYLISGKIFDESSSMFLLSVFYVMYFIGRVIYIFLSAVHLMKFIKPRYIYISNNVGMLVLSSLHLLDIHNTLLTWFFVIGMGICLSSGYAVVYNLPKSFFGISVLSSRGTNMILLAMCLGYFGGFPVNYLYSKNSKFFIFSMILMYSANLAVGFACFLCREGRKRIEKKNKKRVLDERKRKKRLKILDLKQELSSSSSDEEQEHQQSLILQQEQEQKQKQEQEQEEIELIDNSNNDGLNFTSKQEENSNILLIVGNSSTNNNAISNNSKEQEVEKNNFV